MESQQTSGSIGTADDLSLTRREIAFIIAFWLLYAILNAANRVFDFMSRGGADTVFQSGWVVIPLLDSLCWAVLTVPIFVLVARYGMGRLGRTQQIVLFAVVGIVAVVLVAWLGTVFRTQFGTPPAGAFNRGGGRGGGRGGPPPFWFGMLNGLVVYLGVVAAAYARAYSQRYRVRHEQTNMLERQLAEARLDALRRQLDPHFLFNTLNAVASLVERDPRGVRKMISRLGALLRFSLEGADAAEITLQKELALLQQYLDIMQVRFQGRLEVSIAADPDVMDALVPTLILQPLVENAIKHGVEPQRDGGRISIETLRDGAAVILRVVDDGTGAVPATAAQPPAVGGVGLRNTRARLAQLYGGAQRFTLARDGRGTVAEVTIPFHTSGASVSAPTASATDA